MRTRCGGLPRGPGPWHASLPRPAPASKKQTACAPAFIARRRAAIYGMPAALLDTSKPAPPALPAPSPRRQTQPRSPRGRGPLRLAAGLRCQPAAARAALAAAAPGSHPDFEQTVRAPGSTSTAPQAGDPGAVHVTVVTNGAEEMTRQMVLAGRCYSWFAGKTALFNTSHCMQRQNDEQVHTKKIDQMKQYATLKSSISDHRQYMAPYS